MLIRIGTTNINKIVLVVTTFVEYPISPSVSFTKILVLPTELQKFLFPNHSNAHNVLQFSKVQS